MSICREAFPKYLMLNSILLSQDPLFQNSFFLFKYLSEIILFASSPHFFFICLFLLRMFPLLRMSMSPSWIRTSPGYELFIGVNLVCVTYPIARAQTEHDQSYLLLPYSSPDSNLPLSGTITKLHYWVPFL